MVGIQIGREQEEREREEDSALENIEDFNVTSNAEEKFAGATMTSAEDFTFDMTLQLGGEERQRDASHGGVYASYTGGMRWILRACTHALEATRSLHLAASFISKYCTQMLWHETNGSP